MNTFLWAFFFPFFLERPTRSQKSDLKETRIYNIQLTSPRKKRKRRGKKQSKCIEDRPIKKKIPRRTRGEIGRWRNEAPTGRTPGDTDANRREKRIKGGKDAEKKRKRKQEKKSEKTCRVRNEVGKVQMKSRSVCIVGAWLYSHVGGTRYTRETGAFSLQPNTHNLRPADVSG